MASHNQSSASRALFVLHPIFLLTGILHAIGGPLLPSLASTFRLNDSQSGLLLLVYFGGSSLGALLCVGKYARAMAIGFVLVVLCCGGIFFLRWPALLGVFALLGVGVGLPMSAVSLYVGRTFPDRSASALILLNFSWSFGALAAPFLAAVVLAHATFRMAYLLLGGAAVAASLACAFWLRDTLEIPSAHALGRRDNLRAILLFALACFLQVGIENTAAAWLSTYILRTTETGAAVAATLSASYWIGFLVSRAGASSLLRRVRTATLVRVAALAALAASLLLFSSRGGLVSTVAMFLLGVTLGPIYPLIVAESFGHLSRSADSRWILAAAGFGGSVLPWLTGWISAQSGSIRTGILTLPLALLSMTFLLPFLFMPNPPTSKRQS